MIGALIFTCIWDHRYLQSCFQFICNKLRQHVHRSRLDAARLECAIQGYDFDSPPNMEKPLPALPPTRPGRARRQSLQRFSGKDSGSLNPELSNPSTAHTSSDIPAMSWQLGSLILLAFGLIFITIITMHIVIRSLQRTFDLFSSLFLAGTIIFGGGSSLLITPFPPNPR